MIELSAHGALLLYLGSTLIVLLGLWVTHHYTSRRRKLNLNEQTLIVCEYCQYAYLDDPSQPVTRCPRCQSYNN